MLQGHCTLCGGDGWAIDLRYCFQVSDLPCCDLRGFSMDLVLSKVGRARTCAAQEVSNEA